MSSLLGVRVYENLPDAPIPPAVIIELQSVNYDSTFARGSDEYRFSAVFISGRSDDRTAQARIEAWIAGHGTGSVKTAIETDPTLGGICGACRVTEATGLQALDRPDGTSFLGTEFTITLYA
jgi:hypothetical protein